MKEIGGYIELDEYRGNMLHEEGVHLNCGRNALEHIIISKNIKKIYIPKYMCNSNDEMYKKWKVKTKFYSIDSHFCPIITEKRKKDEWLYLVNYYGQLKNDYISALGNKIIVDNSQAYFQKPIKGLDTIYVCRKFLGVPDGAILYTDSFVAGLTRDESFKYMNFLLGRYERTASEFYEEYVNNNERFHNEKLKMMSKLTKNLLHGIDYDFVKKRRTENFRYLHSQLGDVNKLSLIIPEGPFMYPLYVDNASRIRAELIKNKIYVPILWPDVFNICDKNELEYTYAECILPLPIDQRYGVSDMQYIVNKVKDIINKYNN